eukprot:scaffold4973_cov111-Skeletonema_marinoi.AAC.6
MDDSYVAKRVRPLSPLLHLVAQNQNVAASQKLHRTAKDKEDATATSNNKEGRESSRMVAAATKEAPVKAAVAVTISSFIVLTTFRTHATSQRCILFKDTITMSMPISVRVKTKRMKVKESIFRQQLGGGVKAK